LVSSYHGILPGQKVTSKREFPQDVNIYACGAVLTFLDAAGVKWTRKPDDFVNQIAGELTEQPEPR
jgi:hypothetical protein